MKELKLNEKINCLKCIVCGKEYKLDEVLYNCLSCGENLDVIYNYPLIKNHFSKQSLKDNRDFSLHRYWNLLPLSGHGYIAPISIGQTPLYYLEKFGKQLGLPNLYIKDDGRNASASLKDRASAVALAKGLELGFKIISGASTGNAASSLACLSASMGTKVNIFVPKTAPKAKIAQLLIFNATVLMVNGTYDNAFDLCIKACEKYNWYNRNTGYNPFTREGKKVCSYEICEQMNWNVPDKIFVPVGDGNIISGIWKGLKDLYYTGLIERLPQLVGVQAQGSSAVKNAFDKRENTITPVKANTIADSISVDLPRDGIAALNAIKESKGLAVSISDEEILTAMKILGNNTGIFAEPAGVTGFAGLLKLLESKNIKETEKVCVLVTGNGLKDVDSAIKAVKMPSPIEPTLEALEGLDLLL